MTWLSAITLALIVRIVGHIFTVIFAACHSQAREYLRREIKHHQMKIYNADARDRLEPINPA